MSARHWLERDKGQSPGLQRIQEAQQAAAAAKAQAEQQAREAAIAAQEAERKRLEIIARIEQKTAQVLPLLEEIRDFANQTGTYPIGEYGLISGNPQLAVHAKISKIRKATLPERQEIPFETLPAPESVGVIKNIEERINLQYGFRGAVAEEGWVGYGDNVRQEWISVPATINYGISLKIKGSSGKIEILRQRKIKVPTRRMPKGGAIFEHEEIVDDWRIFPTDETQRKSILAEAFHNPVHLGNEPLPFNQEVTSQSEPRANTGITGLVKGFLGLK